MSNNNTKPTAQLLHEIEIADKMSKMTKEQIEHMMNNTDNTFEKLTCWEYLQTF